MTAEAYEAFVNGIFSSYDAAAASGDDPGKVDVWVENDAGDQPIRRRDFSWREVWSELAKRSSATFRFCSVRYGCIS